jgi:hypothetical protein
MDNNKLLIFANKHYLIAYDITRNQPILLSEQLQFDYLFLSKNITIEPIKIKPENKTNTKNNTITNTTINTTNTTNNTTTDPTSNTTTNTTTDSTNNTTTNKTDTTNN